VSLLQVVATRVDDPRTGECKGAEKTVKELKAQEKTLKQQLKTLKAQISTAKQEAVAVCPVCPDGYHYNEGDIKGWGQISTHASVKKVAACSKRCTAVAACNSFEYSSTDLKCNLNSDVNPTEGKAKWGDYAFCSASQCPGGYHYNEGDIKGWGQIDSHHDVKKVQDCSQKCTDDANCNSFEYSRTEWKCNLNSDVNPTPGKAKWGDYAFCSAN
jgi:hypothetical protein